MSVIYYPRNSTLLTREVSGSFYTQQLINVTPNTIFFFGTSSNVLTSSALDLTSSVSISSSYSTNAGTAAAINFKPVNVDSSSYASSSLSSSFSSNAATAYALNFQPINSISSSYASSSVSSSYSLNAGTSSYVTNISISPPTLFVITASTGTIPINLSTPEQLLNITASTNITFSMVSGSTTNTAMDCCVTIYNTSPAITGLYFPSTWISIGAGWATSLTASKSAVMVLKSVNNNIVIGSFSPQL